jgi:Helix-turn-helix domain
MIVPIRRGVQRDMARRMLFPWRHALASEEGPSEPMDRAVALVLALYMKTDGTGAWPNIPTLAARTGLSRRSVGTCLQRLCSDGWLERQPRKSPRGNRHKRYGYEYAARLPARLAQAYANGARHALFTGKDPRRLDVNGMVHGVQKNGAPCAPECIIKDECSSDEAHAKHASALKSKSEKQHTDGAMLAMVERSLRSGSTKYLTAEVAGQLGALAEDYGTGDPVAGRAWRLLNEYEFPL